MDLARTATPFACVAVLIGCTAVLPYPGSMREDCFDGQDDDLDGLLDTLDPDCVVGSPCESDAACGSAELVCATATHLCMPACGPERPCPNHWACDTGICACAPCVERCNDVDDDCDGRTDESTCAVNETCTQGECRCAGTVVRVPSTLDLLFVIDNSSSMSAELELLRAALPAAAAALASGDLDGDHAQDVAPVASLHVGVVTTDLGVGSASTSNCDATGDDGILARGTSCPGTPVFFFETYRDAPSAFASNLSCGLTVEATGCGFSQPLSAALLAVSPSLPTSWTSPGYEPITFHDGSRGHGDSPENEAFLRPDSTLAVVVVTDSDDCSTDDVSFYELESVRFGGVAPNLRCPTFEDQLTPVGAIAERLLSLRQSPQDVFFAAIAGIPAGAGTLSPAQILALPAMQLAPDASGRNVVPACVAAAGPSEPSVGAPGRRLVQLAERISCAGGSHALASICDGSYEGAFRDILRAVATVDARRACVL